MSTRRSGKTAAAAIIGATIIIIVAANQSIKDQPRREAERRAGNRAYNKTVLHDLAESAHRDTELAKKGRVRVGMITEQCRVAWGEPDHINRTNDAGGVHEQWVYASGNCLYFDTDVLKSIQKTNQRSSSD